MNIWVRVDKDVTGNIDKTEFMEVQAQLKKYKTNDVMRAMNLSPDKIAKFIGGLSFQLLLAFIFIAMGIQIFSPKGQFESIINSLIPMSAGASANSSGQLDMSKLDGLLKEGQRFVKNMFDEMSNKLNTI